MDIKHRPKFKYALIVKKLEEAFSIGATVKEACMYADVSRSMYYRWVENNPMLKERFESLLEKPILTARQSVVSALKSNPDARPPIQKIYLGLSRNSGLYKLLGGMFILKIVKGYFYIFWH